MGKGSQKDGPQFGTNREIQDMISSLGVTLWEIENNGAEPPASALEFSFGGIFNLVIQDCVVHDANLRPSLNVFKVLAGESGCGCDCRSWWEEQSSYLVIVK